MGDYNGQRQIGSRYLLLEAIGSGGMGTVWRAEDQLLERSVAVKEVQVHNSGEELAKRVRRAVREARTVARVSHPNVVNVYDLVHEGERLWIVMELVHGRSLAGHLATFGVFSVPQVADIGLQLLDALAAVHAEGALHRDVKPANVLLRADGRAVLCDFGIAWVTDGESLTSSDALVGSFDVMAPERLLNRPVGPPSDLFSLGITLCWLVSGRSPFARSEPAAVMHAVAYEEPEIPDSVGPLRPLVEALLRKGAAERPSAEEAAVALRSLSTGTPTGPRPVLPQDNSRSAGRTWRSRRWVLWAVPLAAVAVVGGAGAAAELSGLLDQGDGSHEDGAPGGHPALPAARSLAVADAMLQSPENDGVYWMFRRDRCVPLRVAVTGGGGPRVTQVGDSMPLRKWAPGLPTDFGNKVDAVMQTPDKKSEFWLFSGTQYVRAGLTGSAVDPDVQVFPPSKPLSDWDPYFRYPPLRYKIDAVLRVWDDRNEYWAFSKGKYVRLRLKNSDQGFAVDPDGAAPELQSLAGWTNLTPGKTVDAVMPVPHTLRDFWVLSGSQYVRVRIDTNHNAERLAGPNRLSNWSP